MTAVEVGEAYEWETGSVIVERFTALDPFEMSAVLVHSHGPFVWGVSGAKAVENAHALEIVAEMALKTLQINPGAPAIPAHLLEKHYRRKHGVTAYYGQA
jgi:L-ribulose-5-phosphate 4-epimerase